MLKRIICLLLVLVISVSFFTVSVFAEEDLGENIALGKNVWASDQYSSGYAPSMVNDGKPLTSWAAGTQNLEGPNGGFYYIAIDLGAVYNITKFIARSRRDMEQAYNRVGWIAQFSNDPNFQTFVEVGRKDVAGDFKSDLEIGLEQNPLAYRYVRVAHEARARMVISEIEVYGEPYLGETREIFTDVSGKTADSANILKSLGIMGSVQKGEFCPYMLMSRMEALDVVLRFAGKNIEDKTDIDKINEAYSMGFISSVEDFRPLDFATVQEYEKMLLYVMGYKDVINLAGGWPGGVYETASSIGLSRATSQKMTDSISRESVANITYRALTLPMYRDAFVVNESLQKVKDSSVLEKVYDMKLFSGTVTANNATNFFEYAKKNKNFVEIDYVPYTDSLGVLGEHIGRKVLFLVRNDAENEIADGFLCEGDEESFVIEMEDIKEYKDDTLKYFTDDEKDETISLSDECVFIKNGVAKTGVVLSDLKAENGTITVIDIGRDGVFDTVYMHVPIVAPVEYCTDDGNTFSFGGTDGTKIKAEYDSVKYYRYGREVLAAQMLTNSLAYCYVSENNKVVRVYCYTNKISGVVTGISSNTLSVDGVEYDTSAYFDKYWRGSVKVGMTALFLANEKGQIDCFVDNEELFFNEQYGIILGVAKQGLLNGEARIFTQNNKVEQLVISEDVRIDGKSIDDTNFENITGQLCIFRTNSQKELTSIITSLSPENRLIKYDEELSSAWYYGNAIYESSAENAYMLFSVDDAALVFNVPVLEEKVATSKTYENDFSVNTFANTFRSGSIGTLEYYNMDSFLTPQIVIRKVKQADKNVGMISKTSPEIYVFDELHEAFYNNEKYYQLSVVNVSTGQKEKMLYTSEYKNILEYDKMLLDKSDVFKGGTRRVLTTDLSDYGKEHLSDYYINIESLKKGDIIRGQISDNDKTMFVAIDRIFTSSDFIISNSYISYGEYASNVNAYFKLRCGTLKNITDEKLQIEVSRDGKSYTSTYTKAENIIVIDSKIKTVRSKELPAYVDESSKVVILSCAGVDKAVFIFND